MCYSHHAGASPVPGNPNSSFKPAHAIVTASRWRNNTAATRAQSPTPDVDSSTREGDETCGIAKPLSLRPWIGTPGTDDEQYTQPTATSTQVSTTRHGSTKTSLPKRAERQLLLSRGNVLGKVLAYPSLLTTDEIHEACGWPLPDVVRANIQSATSGSLSTPASCMPRPRMFSTTTSRHGHRRGRRRERQ